MAIVLDREIERARRRPALARATARRAAPQRRTSGSHRAILRRCSPRRPPAARRGRTPSLVWLSVALHVVLFTVVALMPRRAQTIDGPALPIEIVFTAPLAGRFPSR